MQEDPSLFFLFGSLIILLIVSAFFSGSETGMMAANKIKLRNLSKKQDREETEVEGNLQANKWGTYFSIIIVSGFFIWLLITNGNLN